MTLPEPPEDFDPNDGCAGRCELNYNFKIISLNVGRIDDELLSVLYDYFARRGPDTGTRKPR